jgi:hypothetical protein
MNQEWRWCLNCKHKHSIGIVRYNQQGIPLYGSLRCTGRRGGTKCRCTQFAEDTRPLEKRRKAQVPAVVSKELGLPAEEVQKLWEETSFLSPQAPAASRVAIAKAMALSPAKRDLELAKYQIHLLSDIQGAMLREDSKFALLVAHADEIVEAMKGVVQLKERLDNIYALLGGLKEQTLLDMGTRSLNSEAVVTDAE